MPRRMQLYLYALFFGLAFFLPSVVSAQTLLVDTGSGAPPAITSLSAAGSKSCSPQPSCGQSFQFWAGQIKLTHAATITSVSGWIAPQGPGNLTIRLYSDGGGIPGTALFSQTYNITSTGVDNWISFPFSSPNPTLGAGTYWVAFEPTAFTGTTGTGFTANMDGGAPNPLAHYAVWNEAGIINQFGNGYRAFATGAFSFGFRVYGTNFPDLSYGTAGRVTMAGATFGYSFSQDNFAGDVGQPSIFTGAGSIPGGLALIRAGLFPNSLSTGAWTGASICFSALTSCTEGSGSARSVVFRTWTNPTASSITFSVNADLHGQIDNFGGMPGSSIGRVYLLDPTQFSNTLNEAGTDAAHFLLGSVPVTQDLTGLFPAGTVLMSTSQTLTGPTGVPLDAPLQTGLITVPPEQSFTVMFDVTTITPAGNTVDFFSTLAPANILFTDSNNNPVTQLVAVGPAVAAPAAANRIALAPTTSSLAAGTTQTLTANVADSNGSPVANAIVYFTIATGSPNAESPVPSITDANGNATFTYVDAGGPGSDSIQAQSGSTLSNSVSVTWTTPGPLDHITVNPGSATIPPGGSQAYTAAGFDVFNNSLGNVTANTTFTISPDGSCTGASCTANALGPHTVTASDNGKTAQASLFVGAGKLDTTTSVTSNNNPSIIGQSVTFTATVSSTTGTPTGNVTFEDGTTALASVALSSGAATYSTSSLSVGSHVITAVYTGDNNYNATGTGSSTATPVTQQVQYGVCSAYDPTRSVNSGATYPLKIYLCGAGGNDLSSAAIVLHATSVFIVSGFSGVPEDAGNSNPDNDFRYDSTVGPTGGYAFNLKTTGLASGTYGFTFTVTGDPTTHSILSGFAVK